MMPTFEKWIQTLTWLKLLKMGFIVFVGLTFNSCQKNKTPVVDFTYSFVNDRIKFDASATRDPEGDPVSIKWSNGLNVPFFTDESTLTTLRVSPAVSGKKFHVNIQATDGEDFTNYTEAVQLPDFITGWGLEKLEKVIRNDCNYEWYITQKNTGQHSGNNCGPASTVMAIKWSDKNFTGTPEQARQKYRPDGGWWYTNNIVDYLNLNQVFNGYIKLESDLQNLIAEIDKGNIAILCIDASYITPNLQQPESHVGFPYKVGVDFGHFIVVKGYVKTVSDFYFEIYDPYSFKSFSDGSWIGENRYYLIDDIKKAAGIWWNWAIIISENPVKSAYLNSEVPTGRGG
jgi:hypothetical protein